MPVSVIATRPIDPAHEFRVTLHVFQHACVLPANRAVSQRSASSLEYSARGADCYGAVDHCESRPEEVDISLYFACEVLNLKWKADMQNVHIGYAGRRRGNVYTNRSVVLGNEFQERLTYFSQTDDNYGFG